MSDDAPWFEDKAAQEWLNRCNDELRPMITSSAYTMALLSDHQPDAKQAVEMGFMILLDKPIVVVVTPGVKVPEHLMRCADEVVDVDWTGDSDAAALAISAAIQRLEAKGLISGSES